MTDVPAPADRPELPPDLPLLDGLLLVPSEGVASAEEGAQVVLRRLGDGTLVLPAYTSLGALVACCGPDQPWVALDLAVVQQLRADAGASGVLLDAAFGAAAPETGP